ncbi:iron chelate uptake ABC transporter family permease subunit [Staphylococcus aureus]
MLVILIATAYIRCCTIKLSFNDLFTKFTTGSNEAVDSIIDLRLPRILIALMVGAMLAVSGALLQAALQNPLVIGQYHWVFPQVHLITRALCMLFIPQLYFYLPLLSFIGGLIPFLIIILLHSKFRFNAVNMILVGVALFVLLNGVLEILTQNPLNQNSSRLNNENMEPARTY